MTNQLELFNAHQEDLRGRADSLVRALFVLSGGALTLSIGVLTGPSAPKITGILASVLKCSWQALFAAIVLLATSLVLIIARDYAFGERWRRSIGGEDINTSGSPTGIEVLIWVLAVLGFLCFLVGMFSQAYVAIHLI